MVVRQGGVHIVVGGLRAFGGRGLLWGGRGLQWGGRGLQWGGRGVVQWVGSTLRISSSPPSAASLSAATASDTQSQQGARLSSQRLIEGVEVHEREEQQSGEEISGEAGGSTHTQGQREGSQALRQRRGSERMNKRAESDLGGAEEPEGESLWCFQRNWDECVLSCLSRASVFCSGCQRLSIAVQYHRSLLLIRASCRSSQQ